MELLDYLAVLRKRWVSVVATALVVVAAVVGYTLTSTPQYQATTRLFFAVPGGETVSDLAQGSSFTEKQMSSYAEVATSPLVLGPVIGELGLDQSAEQLRGSIRATVPVNTVILELTAGSTDPARAAALANAVGGQLAEVVADLYPERADGTQTVLATTLSQAVVPNAPASPNFLRNIAIGLLLGLGLGVGVALLQEAMDTKIRSSRDVAVNTQRPVLASILYDPGTTSRPIVMVDEPNCPRAETIRRLRTNLQFVDLGKGSRSILVTSSIEGEGKTTTTANLAVALADAGAHVVLVDADLRRPSLQRILGIESGAGLTTVLIGSASFPDVIQPWHGGRIDVLAAGPIPPNPSELLGSAEMVATLSSLKEHYDVVLIDSPPLLPVTDAAVLSGIVDGTIVVVGAGRAHKAQVVSALQTLEAVGSRILGIVLNMVDTRKNGAQGYGQSYPYVSANARPTSDASSAPPSSSPPASNRRDRIRRRGRRNRHRVSQART